MADRLGTETGAPVEVDLSREPWGSEAATAERVTIPGLPRIMVGMPRLGPCEPEAVKAFCSPATSINMPDEGLVKVIQWSDVAGSTAPHEFNMLLAEALDLRDAGRITHFAMIHSDVRPLGPWLNALWLEMRRTGADLISAVISMKDHSGKTSTAIGDVNDPWRINRYIYRADQDRLPTTFGAADCCGDGEELLVNTGLWLADLRRPWWDDFAFQRPCRIARLKDGSRQAHVRPEDWEMARHLNRAGAKVMATWVVEVIHLGGGAWSNRDDTPPWPQTVPLPFRHLQKGNGST